MDEWFLPGLFSLAVREDRLPSRVTELESAYVE
jgi:hypothetical protein